MINIDFKDAIAVLKAFPDEQTCITHLEDLRWDGHVISPFDPVSKVYFCQQNKYRCKNSGKYFNVKTGTLFHNSKIELQKWFVAIWILTSNKKNITSVELSNDLNITQKTAWYMMKRIKSYYKSEIVSEKKWPLPKIKSTNIPKPEDIEVEIEKDKLQLLEWLQLLKK
jgi:hypothetical protein